MTDTATATQAELDTQAYQALQDADGNATKAAAALGMVRSTFQNRIKRHAARTAQDDATEPGQVSPFVADPENPTDDELAAAVERGLADGTLIDATDWMAQHADDAPAELPDPVHDGDVSARIEASDPEIADLTAGPAGDTPGVAVVPNGLTYGEWADQVLAGADAAQASEDPDESVTALLEDGAPEQADEITAEPATGGSEACEIHGGRSLAACDHAEPAQPAPAKANWTRQAGRKNVEVNFPEGVATPIAFRHHLVSGGDASEDLTTQRVYTMLGRKGFPVRHYDAAGNVYDAPQDSDGVRVTRPGVDLDAARAWYLAKHAAKA